MTSKLPHGTFDMLFASPKNHSRMAKENRDYRDSYNRGRGFPLFQNDLSSPF